MKGDIIMKKRLITAIFMLCMAFCLVACGDNGSDKDSQKPSTEETNKDDSQKESEEESEESGIVYTIKVVDEKNTPIGGMMVQICKDTCMPKLTNAQGIAEFTVAELSDDYYAGITSLPEGYIYEGEEKVYFENGSTEVVFVITSEK